MATLEEVRVLRLLEKYTDEEHRLKQKDIRALFEEEYGEPIGVKPLRRILRDLVLYEDSVECAERGRTRSLQDGGGSAETLMSGFCLHHLFTDEELRLLMDSVTFMPHLPASFKKDIVKKLKSLASRHFRPRSVLLGSRSIKANPELLLSVGELDKAIRQNRKVRLKYLKYTPTGRRIVGKTSSGAERVHVISPYQFAMSRGSYYIICNNDRFDNLAHYRVDRLRDVEIIDSPRRPLADVCSASRSFEREMQDYCEQHAYMLGGDPIHAELECDRRAMPHMIDTFGDNVSFRKEDGRTIASVTAVPDSIAVFARSHAPQVIVLSPESLRDQMKSELAEALALYGLDGSRTEEE